jgi:hypothetical protein
MRSTRRASSSPPVVAPVCEEFPWRVENPLVWLSSCRTVIAPACRPEKASRYCEISAPTSTSPASTSCMTAIAAKLLEIGPDRNGLSGVTSTSLPVLTTPRAPAEAIAPSATTA